MFVGNFFFLNIIVGTIPNQLNFTPNRFINNLPMVSNFKLPLDTVHTPPLSLSEEYPWCEVYLAFLILCYIIGVIYVLGILIAQSSLVLCYFYVGNLRKSNTPCLTTVILFNVI